MVVVNKTCFDNVVELVLSNQQVAMYDKVETQERLRLQYGWQVNSLALEQARKEIQAILTEIDQLQGEGAINNC